MNRTEWIISHTIITNRPHTADMELVNTADMDVRFWRYYGTEAEMKKMMLEFAQRNAKWFIEKVLHCPKTLDEIKWNRAAKTWYCLLSFKDSSYLFTAQRLENVSSL